MMDDEITKNGPIRSQTQLEMFRMLHRDIEAWKMPHNFMPRQTDHAFAAMERWADDGILELADPSDPNNPAGPGAYCAKYRLAREYWNTELAAMDIDRRMRQALQMKQSAERGLAAAQERAEQAWPALLAAIEDLHRHGTDATHAVRAGLAETLVKAARPVEWAPRDLEREEAQHARAVAELKQARAAEAMLMDRTPVASSGDPLDGDA